MGIGDFVVIGNVRELGEWGGVLDRIGEMYDVGFMIGGSGEYERGIGGGLGYMKKIERSGVG